MLFLQMKLYFMLFCQNKHVEQLFYDLKLFLTFSRFKKKIQPLQSKFKKWVEPMLSPTKTIEFPLKHYESH